MKIRFNEEQNNKQQSRINKMFCVVLIVLYALYLGNPENTDNQGLDNVEVMRNERNKKYSILVTSYVHIQRL